MKQSKTFCRYFLRQETLIKKHCQRSETLKSDSRFFNSTITSKLKDLYYISLRNFINLLFIFDMNLKFLRRPFKPYNFESRFGFLVVILFWIVFEKNCFRTWKKMNLYPFFFHFWITVQFLRFKVADQKLVSMKPHLVSFYSLNYRLTTLVEQFKGS